MKADSCQALNSDRTFRGRILGQTFRNYEIKLQDEGGDSETRREAKKKERSYTQKKSTPEGLEVKEGT